MREVGIFFSCKTQAYNIIQFKWLLQIYNENEILETKLNILNKTNMVDYILEIRQQLNMNEEESDTVCS